MYVIRAALFETECLKAAAAIVACPVDPSLFDIRKAICSLKKSLVRFPKMMLTTG